jgi:hypothetical protein
MKKNKVFNKMFNVGVTLVFSCGILLFFGLAIDGSNINESYAKSLQIVYGLWVLTFIFGVLLVLISAPQTEIK